MTEDISGGTVGKALAVLDQVAAFGRPVRFAELLSNSTFPKATLYRLLQTLTDQGMLTCDPATQAYAPGLRLVRLAHAAWAQASLGPLARAELDALSARTGETIHLAQLDGGQVVRQGGACLRGHFQNARLCKTWVHGVSRAEQL